MITYLGKLKLREHRDLLVRKHLKTYQKEHRHMEKDLTTATNNLDLFMLMKVMHKYVINLSSLTNHE